MGWKIGGGFWGNLMTGGGSSIAEAATGSKPEEAIQERLRESAQSFLTAGLADQYAASREGNFAGAFDRSIDLGGNIDSMIRSAGQEMTPEQRNALSFGTKLTGGLLGSYSPILSMAGSAIGDKLLNKSDKDVGTNSLYALGSSLLSKGLAPLGNYVSSAAGGGAVGGTLGGATTGSLSGGITNAVKGDNVGTGAWQGGLTGGISGGLTGGTGSKTLGTAGSLFTKYLLDKQNSPTTTTPTTTTAPTTTTQNALTKPVTTDEENNPYNLIKLPQYGQQLSGYLDNTDKKNQLTKLPQYGYNLGGIYG